FFENSNYNFLLNKIVIYCPYELSLTRLMNRNNLTEFEAKLRLNSQLHIDKKIKFASYLIKNDGNLEDFKDNSLKLIQKLKEKHGIS
ncbi:dephospho-CoA kinase, partial [Campylobacter sp. 2018MI01]